MRFLATEKGERLHAEIVDAVKATVESIEASKSGDLVIDEQYWGELHQEWQDVGDSYELDMRGTQTEDDYFNAAGLLIDTEEAE